MSRLLDPTSAPDTAPLIDDVMPVFDAVERHALTIAAPPAAVYEAVTRVDFARSGPHWALVRPFSGLIRRLMLRAVAREATR
ncbi:MAG TPA: hypothetical protein VMR23_05540 [Candidatus Limnocylindria bacterium]|nr:hypothetical protein [Candidatus Limnocylindria bacterium]